MKLHSFIVIVTMSEVPPGGEEYEKARAQASQQLHRHFGGSWTCIDGQFRHENRDGIVYDFTFESAR